VISKKRSSPNITEKKRIQCPNNFKFAGREGSSAYLLSTKVLFHLNGKLIFNLVENFVLCFNELVLVLCVYHY